MPDAMTHKTVLVDGGATVNTYPTDTAANNAASVANKEAERLGITARYEVKPV
jgi:hypothetical protein